MCTKWPGFNPGVAISVSTNLWNGNLCAVIVSDIYCSKDYQLSKIDFTKAMVNEPAKESHWMKSNHDKLFFLDRWQDNVLYKIVVTTSGIQRLGQRHSHERPPRSDAKGKIRNITTPVKTN